MAGCTIQLPGEAVTGFELKLAYYKQCCILTVKQDLIFSVNKLYSSSIILKRKGLED